MAGRRECRGEGAIGESMETIKKEIMKFFVGKEEVVDKVLICLLAGGHILLEDVPGVGKTTMAKTLAAVLDCDFGRIQFTPDTLPSDVIGTDVYNLKTGEFENHPGAVMHQILLADEINRTSPKTQASLLEAMGEGQVTVGGVQYPLPQPFLVIATQNPVEFSGTYPLPEAQLDRFMMCLSLGYPDRSEELRMIRNKLQGKEAEPTKPVCSREELADKIARAKEVHVSDAMLQYMQNIIELTRQEKSFVLGASPRALVHLVNAALARAFYVGRDFVKPDDVRAVAEDVLRHRLILTAEAGIRGADKEKLLQALIVKAKVPMEKA